MNSTPPPDYPRRFSWKMRLFLSGLLFCMIYSCVSLHLPMTQWRNDYGIETLPLPLPTQAERMALREAANADNPHPVLAAYMATAVSLRDYWNPWPSPAARDQMSTPLHGVQYAACWLDSRIKFLESLVGARQKWEMFAPSVVKFITHARAWLFYDDGSEIRLKQIAEPEDFTHGGHGLLEERILSYEVSTQYDESNSWGYCNLLAHRHPTNSKGAKLVYIVLYFVGVELPDPEADALAWYQEQNRLSAWPPRLAGKFRSDSEHAAYWVYPDYYAFDAVSRQGGFIDDNIP